MASTSSLYLGVPSFFCNSTSTLPHFPLTSPLHYKKKDGIFPQIRASTTSSSTSPTSPLSEFRLFDPPQVESTPSELEPADPDFYKIGYVRSVRAYGVEFMEGPNGFGVYATKDVEPLKRARMIMEIPLELMLTISQKLPWMFFPDIVPVGHPIFDIISSTNPETDWDLRLACLLLLAFDVESNFWQLYGDFLPSADECTSLLLA
ncbi:protein PLASTID TRANSCRIPTIONALLY ACTIVE 14 isoform X1 [Iris pallida]|uniref:Protein PLASTID TRANSCRIPTIONALLY ACTIVE 14 isoform X1 n=1 Tax=Iris pallida TaxID=29817 RepID=A0AAX6G0E9_IRIPA|nr:protein PLASTID TRANSCRIPTIONALLY ACTIVE 14 isoform X1 [Iris pallida]